MPRVQSNGIELEYETFGSGSSPPMVLISGLGGQLITWHEDLCRRFADRGYFVIRFDNRDVGLSTKIEDGRAYTLADMADDAAGLLDALQLEAAHVVGVSMGGMIAQMMAIRHPRRVRTLTSIMSTTGAPDVGGATSEAASRLVRPPATTREERVEAAFDTCRVTWGDTPEFPFDEELARWRAEATVDRCYYPEGTARQLMAIRATGDRTDVLRQLRVPTLVIHGTNDPLVHMSGGQATADAIPGAELLLIEGMGHVVSRPAWDRIVDAVDALAARAAVAS